MELLLNACQYAKIPTVAKQRNITHEVIDLLEHVALIRYGFTLDKNSWMNGYR
jgi:hypothetical protein